MIKRVCASALAAAALTVCTGGVAMAAPSENSQGVGNGAVGCTNSAGQFFANPAEFFRALDERDGSQQATVAKYPQYFSSVGDLINKKCGA